MEPGEIYHIYNHANGKENLFIEEMNFHFFLDKMNLHILPICYLYAYCLMPNHFHLLVKIKEEEKLIELWQSAGTLPKLSCKAIQNKISKHFANLFSSYTQSFNKKYDRMGSLFIPSMKMQLVDDGNYFLNAVHYIHSNPVHHGFVQNIPEWPYCSYHTFITDIKTNLDRDFVLNEFNGKKNFLKFHQQPIDRKFKIVE
jgi:REP element-mobilizing transposase RayT